MFMSHQFAQMMNEIVLFNQSAGFQQLGCILKPFWTPTCVRWSAAAAAAAARVAMHLWVKEATPVKMQTLSFNAI